MKYLPALLLLLLVAPAFAQDCPAGTKTIAADKVDIESLPGVEYLGIRHMPFTDGMAVFYHRGVVTYVSPIIDGCVTNAVFPVGRFRAEQNAFKVPQAPRVPSARHSRAG